MSKTAEEICKAVSDNLKRQKITHQMVAERIGTTKQTISNQLSGKKRFSVNMAHKFASAFGYNVEFLLYGQGVLSAENIVKGYFNESSDSSSYLNDVLHDVEYGNNSYYLRYRNESLKYGMQFHVAERIIEILNNKLAIEAFHAYMREEYDKYNELIQILERNYSYNIPMLGYTPEQTKVLRETRKWFTDVETKAAKELVLIEQKSSKGEIVDVDAEVERFRKRVIWIKEAYKLEAKSRHAKLDLSKYVSQEELDDLKSMIPDSTPET